MQLEFVGHASVLLRRDPVHLLCDPWLDGAVFDNGWALLSAPVFRPEDFASVTHLWFSHEHPDHFNVRTLNMIPEPLRARITVLFHASADRKVVKHCEKMGFGKIIELEPGQWLSLAPGFDIRCDIWHDSDGDDSWLLVRTPEGTLLNLNDCMVVTEEQLATLRASTGDVDVLLTQFSISSWDGNAEELDRRKAGAQAMLDKLVRQTRGLHAKHVVPFASFVWFCHAENAYMNAAIRPVSDAADMLLTQTDAQPVVLYPGDSWTVGETHDSSAAIARYAADFASLPARTPQASTSADLPTLQQAAERFGKAVKQDRSRLRLRLHAARINARQQLRVPGRSPLLNAVAAVSDELMLRVRPARIWLTDHKISLEYSLLYDLQPVSYAREECDIELSSAALLFAFKFLWGGETLQINGRFNELYPDGRIPLFEYLWIACAMNRESGALAQPL